MNNTNNNNYNDIFNTVFNTMGYNSYEKKIIGSSFNNPLINNYIENVSDTLSYHEDKSLFFTDISDVVKDIYNNSSKILNSYQNEKQYIIDKNGIR